MMKKIFFTGSFILLLGLHLLAANRADGAKLHRIKKEFHKVITLDKPISLLQRITN